MCARSYVLMRNFALLCVVIIVPTLLCVAQPTPRVAGEKDQGSVANDEKTESKTAKLGRLPIEWLIGPYIPVQQPLRPLTTGQREQIYLRQTFLTVGSYTARMFSAGLDQARGEPHDWGGGFAGDGRRYASRYGQFVV